MAETTLTLDYWTIIEEVADFLGLTTSPSGEDLERIQSIIESGNRQFLFPPPLGGDKVMHRWSFLAPATTLAISADDYDYDLPDDFGGLLGTFVYDSGVATRNIRMVDEGFIRELRAASDSDGDPYYAATRPKTYTRTTGLRYEVIFYPTPSTSRTLRYRYNVLVAKLSTPVENGTGTISGAAFDVLTDASATFTTNAVAAGDKVILHDAESTGPVMGIYVVESKDSQTQLTLTSGTTRVGDATYEVLPAHIYHLGGAAHSETLLESCLAIAEQRRDDVAGLHTARWLERLQASIALDRSYAPTHLGYNRDQSDANAGGAWDRISDWTYNGQSLD